MSSILKALKKLENQAADQGPFRPWRPNNQAQNTHQKHMDEHVRFSKRYLIILVGLIFAVGTGVLIGQKVREKKPELTTNKETRINKTVRYPEKKTVPSGSVQKELSVRKDIKKSEPMTKTLKTVTPSSQKHRENASVLYNKELSQPDLTRKETITEQRVEKPVQKTTDDRFKSIPVKQSNETKIDLQAIAWSSDPKNRLAVINGLVLREGESIDNASVIHIGKDEVIFKKEGVEWKQLFGF